MVDSTVIVSVLTRCELLDSVFDLKATQMNVQCSPIRELKLYKLYSSHNVLETTTNTYDAKNEDAVEENWHELQESRQSGMVR